MSNSVAQIVLRNPIHILSFGFGSGLSPVAPGTMGTLVAIPIFLVLVTFSPVIYLLFVMILFFIGCWASGQTAEALNVHDHPGIVIDEIVGYLITMVLVPVTWYWVILGFLLFRLFDIWKPWPISIVDKQLKGGLGIMLDDGLAALYSLLSLHIVIWSVKFL
ncbi:MAG: phosphatidylglycerophosphatase A [Gammaproteobacteria bacterium]|nr:phosphatidylglycerophosphatase A [Gammaproteobacteria bacterium]